MFRHMKVTAYDPIVLEFWKQLPVEKWLLLRTFCRIFVMIYSAYN
jgi:hypothetical protein